MINSPCIILIINFALAASDGVKETDGLKVEESQLVVYGNDGEVTGDYDNDQRQSYEGKYGSLDEETIRRLDIIFGYTGPTANDAPENLIRPCDLNNWKCIRNFLAANSQCTPSYGPIPDPLLLEVNTIYLPSVNLSISFINYLITGFNSAKFTEFYVNKKSGNLVMAIEVKNFNLTAPRAYFRYRRTAKESIVTADSSTAELRSITFTAVIPNAPNLRLDQADIHLYTDDSVPKFAFGPKATTSPDSDVIEANVQLLALVPFAVRESFMFQPYLLVTLFIQKTFCDFGIKLTTS